MTVQPATPRGAPRQQSTSNGWDLAVVFVATLAVYLLVAIWLLPYVEPPTGDQPHYLLQTISLVEDGDLDLRNNYGADASYSQFSAAGRRREGFKGIPVRYEVDPSGHIVVRATDSGEAWYPKHGSGLPVLLIPGWMAGRGLTAWLAGLTAHGGGAWPGTVMEMAVIGALLAVQVWLLAWEVSRRRGVAYAVWAAVSFSSPQVLTGLTIFPEAPAALALAYAFRHVAVRPLPAESWWLLPTGLALAGLPWLNPRFVLVAGCLALLALAALWRRNPLRPTVGALHPHGTNPLPAGAGADSSVDSRSRFPWCRVGVRASLLIGPLMLSGLALRSFQLASFGSTAAVADQYEGFFVPTFVDGQLGADWLGLLLAALGLLLDRQFGLLVFAPIYALAVVGVVALWRQPGGRWLLAGLGLVALPYAALTADFRVWWGGWSIPVRYLAVVTPLLAAPLAVTLALAASRGGRLYRALFGVLALAGVLMLLLLLGGLGDPNVEQAIFGNPSRNPPLLRWVLLRFGVDLGPLLPGIAAWFGDRRVTIPWPQIAGCLAVFGGIVALGLYALRPRLTERGSARTGSDHADEAASQSRSVKPAATPDRA